MKTRKPLISFSIVLLLINFYVAAQTNQTAETLKIKPITDYLLYLPDGYDENSYGSWPLILFLHGSGERGDSLGLVQKNGIPKLIVEGKSFPFIIASPQCPEGRRWSSDDLNLLLDELIRNNNVDVDRIYLTGLSMGGFGTWDLASRNPERFAAIAPVCGGGNPDLACRLKEIPAWVFHGAKDEIVFPYQSERMVNALKACGGQVKYTVYPEANHDSWTDAYSNPELYSWFLKQKRKNIWDKEFKMFDKEDSMANKRSNVILFTGSSSIRMWKDLRKDLDNMNVLNRGFGGSTYKELSKNIERLVFRYNPDKVFIYSGDNDIAVGLSAEEAFSDFKDVYNTISSRLPNTQIYIISAKPSPSRLSLVPEMKKMNSYIKNYLQNQENGAYVDVFTPMLNKEGEPDKKLFLEDMLHMNKKGYAIWTKAIKPYLE